MIHLEGAHQLWHTHQPRVSTSCSVRSAPRDPGPREASVGGRGVNATEWTLETLRIARDIWSVPPGAPHTPWAPSAADPDASGLSEAAKEEGGRGWGEGCGSPKASCPLKATDSNRTETAAPLARARTGHWAPE